MAFDQINDQPRRRMFAQMAGKIGEADAGVLVGFALPQRSVVAADGGLDKGVRSLEVEVGIVAHAEQRQRRAVAASKPQPL